MRQLLKIIALGTVMAAAPMALALGTVGTATTGVPASGVLPLAEVLDRLGIELPPSGVVDAACCKRCSKGKACGDSCIARDKRCRKGPGCACD